MKYGILVGMILNLEDIKLYLVECSNWSVAVTSTDHEEASTEAVSHMLKEKGDDLCLSCVIITTDVARFVQDSSDRYEHSVFHPASKILANAGYHRISKNLKDILCLKFNSSYP